MWAHGVLAAAAIRLEVTRSARNSQTVDYSELLPEVGCFGFSESFFDYLTSDEMFMLIL